MQVFGAIFAHFFTDGFGRRYTFVVAALGFILGIGIMVLSSSYQGLLVGRAWVGLGVGIGLAVRAYRSIVPHEPSSSHNFSVLGNWNVPYITCIWIYISMYVNAR
jgi:predicted MFS family arabinose efflux permease